MNSQLEILLQIQDMRSQRDRLTSKDAPEAAFQREAFNVDIEQAVATLESRIAAMEEELDAPVRRRYNRISTGRDRVVAPVIDGTCYACFVSIPTSAAHNEALHNCENCGRFLYLVG